MDDEALTRMRAQLEAESRFIEERGGQRWIGTYIKPYYLKWMGLGAAKRAEAHELMPDVRERAGELSVEDISAMVFMQWRIQVMGTWYAIARADEAFIQPVHDAFAVCYGTLTAPALTAAVLTYGNRTTAGVLRAYRDQDITHQYGASGIITAALRRLEPYPGGSGRTDDDDALDALLDVARQLQDDRD
jgi:hypothetical protein